MTDGKDKPVNADRQRWKKGEWKRCEVYFAKASNSYGDKQCALDAGHVDDHEPVCGESTPGGMCDRPELSCPPGVNRMFERLLAAEDAGSPSDEVVDAYRNGISWGLHHARYHEDMRSLEPIPFCERVVAIAEQQAQRVRRPESPPVQECLKGAKVTPHALQAGITSFGEEYATLGVEVTIPKGVTHSELRQALQALLDRAR